MNEDRWLLVCFWMAVLIGALMLLLGPTPAPAQDPGPGQQVAFVEHWNRFAKAADEVGQKLKENILDLKAIDRLERAYSALRGDPYWPKRK